MRHTAPGSSSAASSQPAKRSCALAGDHAIAGDLLGGAGRNGDNGSATVRRETSSILSQMSRAGTT